MRAPGTHSRILCLIDGLDAALLSLKLLVRVGVAPGLLFLFVCPGCPVQAILSLKALIPRSLQPKRPLTMRPIFLALLVAFFATDVAAHVARPKALRSEELTFNPTNVHVKRLVHMPRTLTNAQRLARGLNPARPQLRSSAFLSVAYVIL